MVRLRTAAGWTQRDLAQHSGLSIGAVRDLEQGRTRSPRPTAVLALSRALGVGPEQLTDPEPGLGPHRIGILGPLDVVVGHTPVELSSSQSLLLGRLAVEAGQYVAANELAELLWTDEVPTGWRALLQSHMARLRRVWADETDAPGLEAVRQRYRLVLNDCELDADRFGAEVDAADRGGPPLAAIDLLTTALGRWRGAVLQDMPDLESGPPARRLHDRRRHAVLRLAELGLSTGRLEPALTYGIAAAEQDALDEPVAAQAVGLLTAAGRPAEAIRVFDRTRRSLRDELGLDPGPELARAHADLVRRAVPEPVSSAARGRGPAQLPRRLADFVGRGAELDRLVAALSVPGDAGVCVVTGLGGMGKTALAIETGHRVRRGFGDGQLFVDLHGHSGAPVELDAAAELLLLGLGHDRRSVPTGLAARGAMLRSELAGRRVLVVLDNVPDDCDVGALIPGESSCGVLITARQRPDGTDGALHLPLDGLAAAEAEALLRSCVGAVSADADPESLRRVSALCDGLPLALRLGAGRAGGQDGWSLRTLSERLAAPHDATRGGTDVLAFGRRAVSATFEVSYRGLTAPQARLVRLFAVSPLVDLSVGAAARLADLPVGEARAALETLATRSVLSSPSRGRFTVHDLMRRFAAARSAVEDTTAEVDASTQRLVGWLTAGADATTALLVPYRVARPDATPTVAGMQDRADAERWLDAEAANLRAALAMTDRIDPAAAWRLIDACGGLFRHQEDAVGWVAAAEAGLRAAEAIDDRVGRIVLHDAAARGNAMRAQQREATTHYRAALDLNTDWPRIEVSLRTNLGISWAALDERDEARAELHRAHDEAARQDMPFFRAAAVNELGNLARSDGDLPLAEQLFTEALEINSHLGDEHGQLINRGNIAQIRALRGDLDAAAAAYRELAAHPLVRRSPLLQAEYSVELGLVLLEQGYARDGVDLVNQGWALAREIDNDSLRAVALLARALATAGGGDASTAHIQLERGRALARGVSDVETELSAVLAAAGLHLDQGDAAAAAVAARTALDLAGTSHNRIGRGRAWQLLARAARLRSDPAGARHAEQEAGQALAGTGYGSLAHGDRRREGRRRAAIAAR